MANQVFLTINVDTKQPVASFKELKDTVKQLQNELNNMKPDAKGFDAVKEKLILAKTEARNFNEELRVTPTLSDRINESVGKVGGAIIGAFAVERIFEFAKASVEAFAKAEESANKLAFAVKNIGGGNNKQLAELTTQAKQLSETSFFTVEQINKSQALQAEFGLTVSQIQKLTPLILDFAVKSGKDLPEATDSALKGVLGQGKALGSLGERLHDTGDKMTNFNNVVSLMSAIQGEASNALNTTNGKLKNQEKNVEELKVEIGSKLAGGWTTAEEAGLSYINKMLAGLSFLNNPALFEATKKATELIEASSKSGEIEKKIFATARLFELEKELKNLEAQKNEGEDEDKSKTLGKIQAIENLITERRHEMDVAIYAHENISKANDESLKKDIETLSKREDAHNIDIKQEIERRKKQLEENQKDRDDASKKAQEANKKFLEGIYKDTEKEKEEELLATAKSEAEKLKIKEAFAIQAKQKEAKGVGVKFNEDGTLAQIQTNKVASTAYANWLKELHIKTGLEIQNAETKANEEKNKKILEQDKKNEEEDKKANIANIELAGQLAGDAIEKDYEHRGAISKKEQAQLNIDLLNNEINTQKLIMKNVSLTDKEKLDAEKKIAEAKKKLGKEEIKQAQADAETRKEIEKAVAGATVQAINMVLDASIQASQQRLQENIKSIDDGLQKQISALDEQQAREEGTFVEKTATQQKYDALRAQAQAEAKAKEKKLKQDEFQKEKEVNIIKAIMSTALAVVSALETPPPLGFVLAGIAGVLGAVQIGIIESQPEPQFASGGILQGKSHKQGGIKTPYGELEGGEIVLTKNVSKDPVLTSLASQINVMAGGQKFATGGILNTTNSKPSTTNVSVNMEDLKAFMNEQRILYAQDRKTPLRSYVVESDISNSQAVNRKIERQSKFIPTDNYISAPTTYLSI